MSILVMPLDHLRGGQRAAVWDGGTLKVVDNCRLGCPSTCMHPEVWEGVKRGKRRDLLVLVYTKVGA